MVQRRNQAANQQQALLRRNIVKLGVLDGSHQHTVKLLDVPSLQRADHCFQSQPILLVLFFSFLQIFQHQQSYCQSELRTKFSFLESTIDLIEQCDNVVDVALSWQVERLKRRSNMLQSKQMFPIAGFWRVKGGKFDWKVVIFLQNDSDCMFEIEKILLRPLLKGMIVSIDSKVHKLYFSVEGYADVLKGDVAVSHSHVVEKSIHSQKFLNVLVHIFGISFEGLSLSVKGPREVLQRLIVVGRRMDSLVNCSNQARQS